MAMEASQPGRALVLALRQVWALGSQRRATLYLAMACMAVVALTTGLYAALIGPTLTFLLNGKPTYGAHGLQHWMQRFLGQQAQEGDALSQFAVLLLAVGAVKGVAYLGQFYFAGLFGQHVVGELRRRLYAAFLTLPWQQRSQHSTGELVSLFVNDVAQVEQAATYTVASYLRDTLQLAVLGAVAFSLSPSLSILVLFLTPIAIVPASKISARLLSLSKAGQQALASLARQLDEGFGALRTIQAFGAKQQVLDRFARRSNALRQTIVRAGWARASIPGVMEVLASCSIAGTLVFVSKTQWVDGSTLASFLGTLVLLYQPAKDLGRVSQFAVSAATAFERLNPVLSMGVTEPVAQPALQQSVALRHVHFSWGDVPTLEDITLSFSIGERVALVGPSGSGKSTLCSLMLGFVEPSSGEFVFDGIEPGVGSAKGHRASFAAVSQEPLLLATTVGDNIKLARAHATASEVEVAARLAGAHEFIATLPEGYKTSVGERGALLSVGQKQRICLARALLSTAPVLLLDEATSALDAQTEAQVIETLFALPRQRTVILVAHRLSAVRRADRIVVFEAGRVVEQGTHHSLLLAGGVYARLWNDPAAQ